MDAVTVGAVLAAVAGGAGGAVGKQVWDGAVGLVRRPVRHRDDSVASPVEAVPSGAVELAALERSPGDRQAAEALAGVLVGRAAGEEDFAQEFAACWEQARHIEVAVSGDVTNTVSGGTQNGPALQGRDFTGLTFGAPPLRHAPPGNGGGM